MMNDSEQMRRLMETGLALSYLALRFVLKLSFVFLGPIISVIVGFDWAGPTSNASLLSALIALASIAIGLKLTLPDLPDFDGMSRGGGMTPPGVPVEATLRVPVRRKRKMPEPPLPPL